MRLAVEEFLSAEATKRTDKWEQEIRGVVDLMDNAAVAGVIPAGPDLVTRQMDLISTMHSFRAASLDDPILPEETRPTLDFPDQYNAGAVDREGWFQDSMQLAREGDWRPLMDYFDKFIRQNVYFGLNVNFGFKSEPYDDTQAVLGEDIVQDAWLKTVEHFHRLNFPNGYNFYGWFRRLAMNRAIDLVRKRPPFEELSLEGRLIEDKDVPVASDQPDILRAIAIRKAILGMDSPQQRQVLILKFFSGYSNRVIGDMLGITEGAAKSLQHRGLATMGRILTRRYMGQP